MRRFIWPLIALALIILYPLVFTTPFQQRLGALILLYAIAASAWNIIGGYAGQVSVGHVVFFGCGAYGALGAFTHLGLPPIAGLPIGVLASVVGAYYYLRIIKIMYFDEPAGAFEPMPTELRVVLGVSGAFVLFFIVFAGFFLVSFFSSF